MYNGWVFVDVDGTLIDKDDNPRPYIKELFEGIKKLNLLLVVWSGGGKAYAEKHILKLGQDYWNLVDEFRWKGTPISWNHIRPVFFVDDSELLLFEHLSPKERGFKVPFYEKTLMPIDSWLLKALVKIREFYK